MRHNWFRFWPMKWVISPNPTSMAARAQRLVPRCYQRSPRYCPAVTRYTRPVWVVRGGATAQGGRGARRLNHVLVVTETALALMVLVASVLLVRSAGAVRDVEKGFDSENRLVFRTSAVAAGFSDAADVARHHAEALRVLREMPGVEASGAVTAAYCSSLSSSWKFIEAD